MTEKEKIEDLMTEILSDATSLKIVFNDMRMNDFDNIDECIDMGLVFCERLMEHTRQANEMLLSEK